MSDSGMVALFSPSQHSHLIPYLAAIHASCITHDRTIATFLPPLSHEKLLAWWKERIAEVNEGKRLIFVLLSGTEQPSRPQGKEVMGVVMLSMPYSETGPFRGVVEKLLVHKSFRGRGGARTLINALEAEAAKRGRTTLVSHKPCSSLNIVTLTVGRGMRYRNRKPSRRGVSKVRLRRGWQGAQVWHESDWGVEGRHFLLQTTIEARHPFW